MFTATYLSGPWGAAPRIPKRTKDIKPLVAYLAPLLDGPRWIIGPWNFSDDNKPHVVTLSQRQFGSKQGLPYQHWLGRVMGHAMGRFKVHCKKGVYGSFFIKCDTSHKGWSVNMRLPQQMWEGKIPLAKTKHPVTGRDWAFYAKFEKNKVIITFKRIEPGWLTSLLGAIWNFITTVVGVIVDTVTGLFDFLKTLGCSLARSHMNELAALAAGSAGIPPSMVSRFGKLGVTKSELEKVKNGATSTMVQTIGNKVADAICGPKPLPPSPLTPPPTKAWYLRPTTWALFGVGALALGGGAYYYTRKPT